MTLSQRVCGHTYSKLSTQSQLYTDCHTVRGGSYLFNACLEMELLPWQPLTMHPPRNRIVGGCLTLQADITDTQSLATGLVGLSIVP